METKVCKQCGELKPIGLFRKYYGGRKGTYKTCKACEKINSREKYLMKKDAESHDAMSQLESMELEKIHKLWDIQRAAGLQPPRTTKVPTSLVDSLDELMAKYEQQVPEASDEITWTEWPNELSKWFLCDLTEDPDYYLDEVYEQLKEKYRPIVRIEDGTKPVYDNTYKDALDKVLDRFYAYEDSYYSDEATE